VPVHGVIDWINGNVMPLKSDTDRTREWLGAVMRLTNEVVARDIVAAACLLYHRFRAWPSRTRGVTPAKLRRKYASVRRSEDAAFFDCHVFLHPEHVSRTALQRYPGPLVAAFIDGSAAYADPAYDHWPLLSMLWHRCRAGGLFNPVNLKFLLRLENRPELIDWPLPDPHTLFPELRVTDPRQMSVQPVTTLMLRAGDNHAEFLRLFRTHAAEIEQLTIDIPEVNRVEEIAAVTPIRLRDLTLGSLELLRNPTLGPWLSTLPALRRLRGTVPLQDADDLPQQLRSAVWWPQLTALSLKLYRVDSVPEWNVLWSDGMPALQELRVRWLSLEQALVVLRADLPELRSLALQGSNLGSAYLHALINARLPNLEDLDLRGTLIEPDEFRAVAQNLLTAFPKLRRVGISFASDRRVDYYDWSGGPPVDWAYDPMTAAELRTAFLDPVGLALLEEHDDV
jgi:hypothetical protein